MDIYKIKNTAKTEERVMSVAQLIDYINQRISFQEVIIEGEIGKDINQYPGFIFFNLLDVKKTAMITCFAFKSIINQLALNLQEGMKIKVLGYPQVRKEKGTLSFFVEKIELQGEGALKKQFEILKKQLQQQGYFDIIHKKRPPLFCQKIGLITSKYGKGALKDFITHLENFGLNILFRHSKVEGITATEEIIDAIQLFNQKLPPVDVLVIVRGGGDWESLKAFNCEKLVKAIFSSKIPIMVGVGHENDITLADLVADIRASTPTHAAKIISENWKKAKDYLQNFAPANFNQKMKKEIQTKKHKIELLFNYVNFACQKIFKKIDIIEKTVNNNLIRIKNLIDNHQAKLFQEQKKTNEIVARYFKTTNLSLLQQEEKIFVNNPDLKLKQGYSIIFNEKKQIVKDINMVSLQEEIIANVHNGKINSIVKKIKKER
jgi:exodeoxyribonuclease VII large subunit